MAILAAVSCSNPISLSKEEKELILGGEGLMRVLTVDNSADSAFLRIKSVDFDKSEFENGIFGHLAKRMVATVTDPSQDGVGIAGPQVGLSRRVVAVQRFDKEGEPFEVYPNISIRPLTDEMVPGGEGCLSVPGYRGQVMRYSKIEISYTSPETLESFTEEVAGCTAVICQHECDHLEGILYIDRCDAQKVE